MKNFGEMLVALLVAIAILFMPAGLFYAAYSAGAGRVRLEEMYPSGSLVKLKGDPKEYVVLKSNYEWYFNDEKSQITIVDPKLGVKMQIDPKDLIRPGTPNDK